ncbi:xanthine dehydrogenase family protein molybdopterin-binding subunit [Mesoaciditoga lauensis]|uniref:xanthine dehydrogenase family protein molybdopterin-binding subunit n=1 Tax=Mesoaciditoga lauensis TaxID=1495039 RepID=UPI00068E08D6|nr:xanthine dehydrogenase family protein molybdopterin-binding subunit [Mesoaciditoga lauensis]
MSKLTTEENTFSIIGKKIPRVDAIQKVKGEAKFVADFDVKDMLYGVLVLSKHARARVKKIDTSKAKSLEGVKAVLTYKDVPGENQLGEVVNDMPCLVPEGEEVKYHGDVVALVAAESLQIAKKAAELVEVEYEELQPVLTIEEALKNEIKVHPKGNILTSKKIRKGNVENGFFESDLVIEDDFYAHYQEQAYLEPQGVLTLYDNNYGLTVYGSMQCPYYVQEMVPRVLGISMNEVRVIQAETGGAFGGKEDVPSYVAAQCSLLTYHTKRPVLLTYSREVDIQTTSKRHPIKSHYKIGVTKDGKIKAIEVTAHMDMGAYATLSPIVMYRSLVHAAGAYEIPNVKVDIDGVYTNKVPCGAFRGFGSPQVLFAVESIVDEAAKRLNIDPIEFRLKNALRVGSRTSTDQLLEESVGAVETLEHAAKISNYPELKKRVEEFNSHNTFKKRGIGVSHIIYGMALGAAGQHLDAAGSLIQVHKDGSVNIHIGNTEMGQGAKTVIAMIASEALGQKIEKIRVDNPDTSYVQDSGPTVASRATVFSGNAVKEAAEKIKARMIERFAKMNDIQVSDVVVEDGIFKSAYDLNGQKMSFDELAKECYNSNIKMVEKGWFVSPKLHWDPETGIGEAYITYAYATQIVVVEVDLLTGKSQVVQAYTSHDVGKKLNPNGLIGQVQGGFVQGMGYGLFEDIKTVDGKIVTDNFNTYIIPTVMDIPQKLEIDFVEDEYSHGPFGAKGIGEPSLMPTPAAVANAISAAIGKRVKRIPATAEYVLNLIDEK